jgi:hypothetical protein
MVGVSSFETRAGTHEARAIVGAAIALPVVTLKTVQQEQQL